MNSRPETLDTVEIDFSVDTIVRKTFRVPLEISDNVWITIGNNRYPVRDISATGVGIKLESPLSFNVSQIIGNCELSMDGQVVKDLEGRVVHFSLNSDREWQYGIQWVRMNQSAADRISETVFKLKDKLLRDDQ